MFKFEIIYQSSRSRARVGKIHTPHGIIETPNFVPVATNAAVKAVDSILIDSMGIDLLFCNTYHLLLHPGPEIIRAAGGLHKFMARSKPIITDSGGFQVFSLAYGTVHDELKSRGQKKQEGSVVSLSEEGVLFRSYRDGALVVLTPESSIQVQKKLGADIIIPLDELPPYHIDPVSLKKSLDRTHRWEERSLREHNKDPQNQAIYAVIHGGIDPVLRAESARVLTKLPFDGFAIGGSLGKTRQEMLTMLDGLMPQLPEDKPSHLLGIGDLCSLESSLPLGIDTYDSSHPTRCARHGFIFTKHDSISIKQGKYKRDFGPLEFGCACFTCTNYTRAYVHHLFKAHELNAYTLASIHNLYFMVQLMAEYRHKILNDQL